MGHLQKKRILLGITGGIAAYKSPDIVRRLQDAGAEVRVVMTASAARLITPTVFQAVSAHPVRVDLWDAEAEAAMGHIELARWADYVLVAPATAHFMSQLAAGAAGNLLSTLCLATEAPILLAPAMNQVMWRHPATQANRATLESRGVRCIGPAVGSQACGDVGPGRMVEPAELVEACVAAVAQHEGEPQSAACSPDCGYSSRLARRANRSIRCVSSATGVPERWALRSYRRLSKQART